MSLLTDDEIARCLGGAFDAAGNILPATFARNIEKALLRPMVVDYRRLIRDDFEQRMRAAGHGPTALSRLDSGIYLSPVVQMAWNNEKRRYAAPHDEVRVAAQYVLDRFRKTQEAGYSTRDREFAISVLAKALENAPCQHENTESVDEGGVLFRCTLCGKGRGKAGVWT